MFTIKIDRTRAYRAQAGRCFYCDAPTWLADPDAYSRTHRMSLRCAHQFRATAEHLVARQDGGRGGANIVVACWLCNHRRHARPTQAPQPDAYRASIRKRRQQGRWWPRGISFAVPLEKRRAVSNPTTHCPSS